MVAVKSCGEIRRKIINDTLEEETWYVNSYVEAHETFFLSQILQKDMGMTKSRKSSRKSEEMESDVEAEKVIYSLIQVIGKDRKKFTIMPPYGSPIHAIMQKNEIDQDMLIMN